MNAKLVERSVNAVDCRTRMAKVQWSTGIDHVSGALSKPGKNPQHSCTQMLLGTHRTAETTNPNCNRLYLRQPITRSRFGSIAAAVNARLKDPSKMAADQAAYRAQKNTAGGKQSMKAYIWSLEMAAFDGQP